MSLISTKSPQEDKFVNVGSPSGCPFYLTWSHLVKTILIENIEYVLNILMHSFQDFESLYRWKYIGNDRGGIGELK